MLSDDSDIWGDNMSQDLYDSDNPDCPLNAYHIESKPRLLRLEDYNDQGRPVQLAIDCLEMNGHEPLRKMKKGKKDDEKTEIIDHR